MIQRPLGRKRYFHVGAVDGNTNSALWVHFLVSVELRVRTPRALHLQHTYCCRVTLFQREVINGSDYGYSCFRVILIRPPRSLAPLPRQGDAKVNPAAILPMRYAVLSSRPPRFISVTSAAFLCIV